MDWLLALLGRSAESVPVERVRQPGRAEKPIRPELIEGPPPATPRIILTPAPIDEGRPTDDRHRPHPQHGGAAAPADERREPRSEPASSSGEPNHEPRRTGRPAPPRTDAERQSAQVRPAQRPSPTPASPRRPEPVKPERAQERPAGAPQAARSTPAPTRGAAPVGKSDDDVPDPAALIARLRRQREQREQREAKQGAQGKRRQPMNEPDDVEPRFAAGDHIFCLPYGDGVVRDSRIEGGRELLTVSFPNHGDLMIDPAVSLVRKLEDTPDEDDS
jgi:DEAD/DEAH box helicase domain-containing protein